MPRFPRRRGRGPADDDDRDDEAAPEPETDNVDLGGSDNAWWSERELTRPWEPRQDEPGPDPLDEHLGDGWRQEFGFEQPRPAAPGSATAPPPPSAPSVPPGTSVPPAPRPGPAPAPPDEADDPAPAVEATEAPVEVIPDLEATDPYAVLGVQPGASWAQILAAHRALARRYHPDKVATYDVVTRGHAEDIMFKINAAYRDLKIRRGK